MANVATNCDRLTSLCPRGKLWKSRCMKLVADENPHLCDVKILRNRSSRNTVRHPFDISMKRGLIQGIWSRGTRKHNVYFRRHLHITGGAIAEDFEKQCHSIQESFQFTNQKLCIPGAVENSARGSGSIEGLDSRKFRSTTIKDQGHLEYISPSSVTVAYSWIGPKIGPAYCLPPGAPWSLYLDTSIECPYISGTTLVFQRSPGQCTLACLDDVGRW